MGLRFALTARLPGRDPGSSLAHALHSPVALARHTAGLVPHSNASRSHRCRSRSTCYAFNQRHFDRPQRLELTAPAQLYETWREANGV